MSSVICSQAAPLSRRIPPRQNVRGVAAAAANYGGSCLAHTSHQFILSVRGCRVIVQAAHPYHAWGVVRRTCAPSGVAKDTTSAALAASGAPQPMLLPCHAIAACRSLRGHDTGSREQEGAECRPSRPGRARAHLLTGAQCAMRRAPGRNAPGGLVLRLHGVGAALATGQMSFCLMEGPRTTLTHVAIALRTLAWPAPARFVVASVES